MSDEPPTPNTSSSDPNATSVGGNVATGRDFVGRDLTVHGDQVQGDKITAGDKGVAAGQITDSIIVTGNNNIIGDGNTVITQRLDPTDARNQRNHATMRQLVRTFWIDGVLKSSLYNEALIRLNLTEQPKAVDNRPWDLILQQPGQPNYALPAGISIVDVFDQMNQRLLILGEPGSGKTTTLLELADALLNRAKTDPTHPTPVVFNLSSWAEQRQPLAEWLVDELRTKYNIPRKVAQKWVEDDELLLLLDGLDEVKQQYRNECVVIINQFRHEHLVPVAVCSRVNEYEELAVQLKLQGAVLVQPLTLAQINEYLDKAGVELSTMRVTLQQDKELQEMATSPLLLSIIVLAYHGTSIASVSLNSSTYPRRQHLFDAYVRRMFLHREYSHSYPIQKTIQWLSWLAENMNQRQQTIFLIEGLQPDWLQRFTLIWLYRLVVVLVCVVVVMMGGMLDGKPGIFLDSMAGVGLGVALLGILLGVLAGGLAGGLASGLFILFVFLVFGAVMRAVGLGFIQAVGLGVGLGAGLLGVVVESRLEGRLVVLLVMLGVGMGGGLVGLLFGGLESVVGGVAMGMFGLVGGVLSGVLFRMMDDIEPIAHVKFDSIAGLSGCVYGVLLGVLGSVLLGIVLKIGEVSQVVITLGGGLLSGLGVGLLLGLKQKGISQTIYPNQSIWLSAKNIPVGGGGAVIKHFILRFLLWSYKLSPLNYTRFLDYCHTRLFLRKVGGGYIFIHRLLLEHFASLTNEDIKRIAADVEASRK